MVIFLWKISQGIVSGYDVQFASDGTRRGRTIIPKTVVKTAPANVKKARENTLRVRGGRIFNLLPGLGRGDESNSLIHPLPLLY